MAKKATTKKGGGFDVAKASSAALADFGGAADTVIKKQSKLLDTIKAELRSRAGNLPKDEVLTATGEDFTVSVGKVPERTNIKEMDNAAIIELVGQDVFNAAAVFPVGRLRDFLSKKDFDKISSTEDGTRSVSFKTREND